MSSIDRNASERGQSQFSNPTDDSWKGAPYASKTLLFWVCCHLVILTRPDIYVTQMFGKHRSANKHYYSSCSSSFPCHSVARLTSASLKSFYPYTCKYMHVHIHICTYTHVSSSPFYTSYRIVCDSAFSLNASFTINT